MDTALPPPPCLSILGFLGYSDDPGIIPGWTQLTPPLSQDYPGMDGHSSTPPPLSEYPGIPGILGRSWDHPRMDRAHPPPCLSILGFLGYSDDPRIIPGWMDTALPPPLSEYPGIPGILGRSWDHPRMDTAHPPCLSILGFLGSPPVSVSWDSWDTRTIPGSSRDGWTQLYPTCLSILGFLGYSDDPGIIPGWMDTALPPPCLSILGFLGYSDDPGIIPGWMDTALPPPV